MSLILFSGPSLSEKEVEEHWRGLDYTLYPPVRQGDIYLACRKRPEAIGIIDGYFERVPSVWHKEILWAMDQGIHVFGAASMGALRAAELSFYGMQGVGKIFADFQSGELEDDDEVTIIHSTKEEGYINYSEAMVNIRATLQAAEVSGIIDEICRKKLLNFVKQLHYSERSYDSLLRAKLGNAKSLIGSVRDIEKLKQFIEMNSINQKREDALALLKLMSDHCKQGFSVMQPDFVFQYTENWQQMLDQLTKRQGGLSGKNETLGDDEETAAEQSERQVLLRVLQNNKNEYQQIDNAAKFRSMAIQESYRQGVGVTEQMLIEEKNRFCRENNFIGEHGVDLPAIQNWLKQQQLTMLQFDQLLQEQARFHWYCSLTESLEENEMIDYLKISGKYRLFADHYSSLQPV